MHNPFPLSTVGQPTFLSAAPSAEALSEFVAAASGRPVAPVTPAVRFIARRLRIDVARVKGTGAAGQVTIADVRAAASAEGSR
ncbi:E3 binding domain-containing protein [Microbacterium sp.]|uniref:E3 binding domain-containing protein n=1 Tax=Microbacterium sp. TaxID=51671 RepID=UPI0035613AD1